jgi:hypothetical protein
LNDASSRNPPTVYLRTESSKKAVGSIVLRILNNAATNLTFTVRVVGIHD